MSGLIVVDVGNTRVKWGRCEEGRVVEVAALPPDSANAWQTQLNCWPGAVQCSWFVSGVHPRRRDTLVAWLRSRVAGVQEIDSYQQIPLAVLVDEPEKVGIDRLFNAVAANTRRPSRSPAVIVDAGSAITVDLVNGAGAFRGGAIFPGLHLMARALHDHTALLPSVDFDQVEQAPATSTVAAIRAGIFSAVRGGIWRLVCRYVECVDADDMLPVYVTGGDAALLVAADPDLGELWPEMTLHGILHSVAGSSAHG